MKKAILIVSVGTSEINALENTTLCLQQEAAKQFEDYQCYVAFSSQHILEKMNVKSEVTYYGVSEVFEQMYQDGIEEVVVQPTNLLNGLISDSVLTQIEKNHSRFKKILVGKPLLHTKEDYMKTLQVILAEVEPTEEEAIVLIGHGTSHAVNNTYQNLEYTAYTNGYRNVFIGTMEGEKSQKMALRKLRASGFKKVHLLPLLFVAGYHARKDIAAESDSWKSVLEDAGYEVIPNLIGIGELDGIRTIFMEHLKNAMEQ